MRTGEKRRQRSKGRELKNFTIVIGLEASGPSEISEFIDPRKSRGFSWQSPSRYSISALDASTGYN
jgi:hypothetical protein